MGESTQEVSQEFPPLENPTAKFAYWGKEVPRMLGGQQIQTMLKLENVSSSIGMRTHNSLDPVTSGSMTADRLP